MRTILRIDLAVGYWLLAVGCWLLAISYWPLTVGRWLITLPFPLSPYPLIPSSNRCWLPTFSFAPSHLCDFTLKQKTLTNRYLSPSPFLLVSLSLLLTLPSCGRSASPTPITLDGRLTITAPDTATVGDTIELTIGPAAAPNGTPIQLTLLGSYGPQLLRAEFQNGQAWFQIPAEMTTRSGTVTLHARSGNAHGEHTLELLPDEPIEPLIPLVGPRSLIADGDHWAMAVVIPFDQYGNPIAEGTPVQMRALHPGEHLTQYTPKVKHLLAWQRMYSRTTAGRTVITANIGRVYGPEAILMEIAGWPEPFTITADPPTLPADGFQLITLRTSIIRDKNDNILPDGTQLTFVMNGADGRTRTIPAQIVDGVAETFMQTPLVSGDYKIQATILGMQSNPLTIEFTPGPAIGRFPLDFELNNQDGAVYLTAGPIIGNLEQYVPDGTPVTFEITDEQNNTQTAIAYTDQGYATAELRRIQFTDGRYEIHASAGSGSGHIAVTIKRD